MYLTLALVVFIAAIITLFSQEFIRMFKKIMAIKGAKLFLPLVLASWAVITFHDWILIGIYYYREVLNGIVKGMTWIMPFGQFSSYTALILIITSVCLIPVFFLNWFWYYRTYKAYPYPYLTSIMIWLISVFTLIVL